MSALYEIWPLSIIFEFNAEYLQFASSTFIEHHIKTLELGRLQPQSTQSTAKIVLISEPTPPPFWSTFCVFDDLFRIFSVHLSQNYTTTTLTVSRKTRVPFFEFLVLLLNRLRNRQRRTFEENFSRDWEEKQEGSEAVNLGRFQENGDGEEKERKRSHCSTGQETKQVQEQR